MRNDVEAGLIGAASIMDLSGETVLRYSRRIRTKDVENRISLMCAVRRGQDVMFLLTLIVLTIAVALALNHMVVAGGALGITWTLVALGISVWELKH